MFIEIVNEHVMELIKIIIVDIREFVYAIIIVAFLVFQEVTILSESIGRISIIFQVSSLSGISVRYWAIHHMVEYIMMVIHFTVD